jgi:hypothetical protein
MRKGWVAVTAGKGDRFVLARKKMSHCGLRTRDTHIGLAFLSYPET